MSAASNDPPIVGIFMKIARFITKMSGRDLLVLGFIISLVLLIGSLSGYINTPIQIEHYNILGNIEKNGSRFDSLIELERLQLYLSRETCLHTAKTESEKTRCDRQSVREAISSINNDIIADSHIYHAD